MIIKKVVITRVIQMKSDCVLRKKFKVGTYAVEFNIYLVKKFPVIQCL